LRSALQTWLDGVIKPRVVAMQAIPTFSTQAHLDTFVPLLMEIETFHVALLYAYINEPGTPPG
jgi:hypothetical protein